MGLTFPSQIAIYTTVFLSCVSFSIVLPSMWPYLESLNSTKHFLATVVATYSIGEAFGALVFGALFSFFKTRLVMQAATIIGIVGSMLYILAQLFPLYVGQYLVLCGRLLQGIWTGGAQALQTSYFAAVLPVDQLTPSIVILNAYACLGFVIGPVFGLFVDILPPATLLGLELDERTSPGFFVLVSGIIAALLFGFVFDEEKDRGDASSSGMELSEDGLQTEAELLIPKEDGVSKSEETKAVSTPHFSLLLLCNLIFFVHFYGFALQETITTPLVQTYYNWSVFTANLLFTVAGICALVSFFGLGILSRVFSDRTTTLSSLVLGVIGYILLMSHPPPTLPEWRFLAGFIIISIAFPIGRAATTSLYTKLLPLKMQGQWQGILLAVGAVARILGPFWAVRALIWDFGGILVFGGTALMFALCIAGMGSLYKQLEV